MTGVLERVLSLAFVPAAAALRITFAVQDFLVVQRHAHEAGYTL